MCLLCTIWFLLCSLWKENVPFSNCHGIHFYGFTFCVIEEASCVENAPLTERKTHNKKKNIGKFSVLRHFYSREIFLCCNGLRFGENPPNSNNKKRNKKEKFDILLNFQTQEVNQCKHWTGVCLLLYMYVMGSRIISNRYRAPMKINVQRIDNRFFC